jgi:hypothetical protein
VKGRQAHKLLECSETPRPALSHSTGRCGWS